MGPGGSFQFSQEPATGSLLEPDKFDLRPEMLFS
jgi:hypothetical protein